MKELWDKYYNGCDMSDLFNSEEYLAKPEKAEAKSEPEKKETAAAAPAADLTDDTEPVAVISAAIAASEGTTTEGFVVRSINRR